MQNISSLNVVDLLLDAVCIVEPDSRIVFVSAAFERIFGYRPDEVIGRRMLDMVHPDDLGTTQQQAQHIMNGHLQLQFENRYIRKDGSIAHIRWTARWLEDRQVRLAVAHDITERKHTETMQAALYAISEAAHAAQGLQTLFDRIRAILGRLLPVRNVSVALYDADSDSLRLAYQARESGPASRAAWPLQDDARYAHVLQRCEPLLLTPADLPDAADGEAPLYWLGIPLCSLQESDPAVQGVLVLESYCTQERYTDKDIELLQFVSTQVAAAIERKQMHARLERMAQYDTLTQLPNRQLFLDRLQTALRRAQRDQSQLALLFLDLDRFKEINDTLGHAAGDQLLQQVAQRLLECVRGSDTVARLGGDEFVLLLESCQGLDNAMMIAHKVLEAFDPAFLLGERTVSVQPSIGVALHPDHGAEEHHLLNLADEAMYHSKKSGGNQVRVAVVRPLTPPQ